MSSKRFKWHHVWCMLLTFSLVGAASAVAPIAANDAQLLEQADKIKSSDSKKFAELLIRLDSDAKNLTAQQQIYLTFLKGWQAGYAGNYAKSEILLQDVIHRSTDVTLRFRAQASVLNMLGIGSRYSEAYEQLGPMLDQLPQVTDTNARVQGLGVASILYNNAGQYDLASFYADQVVAVSADSETACKGKYLSLQSRYKNTKLQTPDELFQDGIDACVKANEPVFENLIRSFVASRKVEEGKPAEAIELLRRSYPAVQRTHYPVLISTFDALLAQSYWNTGKVDLAEQFANDAVKSSVKNEYTESLVAAYKLLYQIAKQQGDDAVALSYHEKYMAADKGYLNEVSAKALAFQTVKQQLLAKKMQIDTLNKQNQILTLQQKLGKKAAETSRLYIVLLLGVLATIGLWSYRVKRSQLRFMKLARRDGLTGIFNRQHFVSEAELALQYCKKSSRDASLLLIDLDHFKLVNDTHGHAVGDRVLRRAVDACKAHLRSTDIFGRLGGEEFGILLPECSLEQAAARAEQIRAAIGEAAMSDELPRVTVSASFGVASSAYSGYELRQLLIHADEALYQAKRDGRNRVNVNDNQNACLKMG